jgi:pimeloyl-ACP methyl ester carboxylesterase
MKFITQGYPAYAYTGGKELDPAKSSAVFIHGTANDHSVWQLQSRWFANHGWNVLAVDLPAHGQSPGTPRETIGAMADWLASLLDTAGIAKAAFVGHSMGSLVAVETALRFPEKVTRLALLGASLPMLVSEALLDAARNDPGEAFAMLNNWGHAQKSKLGASPSPGIALMGSGLALLERSRPGVVHSDLRACSEYLPTEAKLAAITCPVLVLAGTRDLLTPARAGAAVAALLPGAKVVTLEGAGHAMASEDPEGVLRALRGFLG